MSRARASSTPRSKSRQLRSKRDWRSKRDTWLFISFLGFVCFFQILGQTIERSLPEFPVFFDPANGLLHWLCFQFQLMDATIVPAAEQSGFLQKAEMV